MYILPLGFALRAINGAYRNRGRGSEETGTFTTSIVRLFVETMIALTFAQTTKESLLLQESPVRKTIVSASTHLFA